MDVICRYCQGVQQIRRQGVSKSGHQRYRCEQCHRTFQVAYSNKAYEPGIKDQILDMVINGSGIRNTARALKVNMNTVMSTIKKKLKP
ncbi:MAG: IS1 family transposase [Saprospiraceae bacterium]|nr:IS1 family transposase [Saprospiraceae bacterium]